MVSFTACTTDSSKVQNRRHEEVTCFSIQYAFHCMLRGGNRCMRSSLLQHLLTRVCEGRIAWEHKDINVLPGLDRPHLLRQAEAEG